MDALRFPAERNEQDEAYERIVKFPTPLAPAPLDVLHHTAQCILRPECLWEMAPELLEVIAQMEILRLQTLELAQTVLQNHGLRISEKQRAALEKITSKEMQTRLSQIYMAVSWSVKREYVRRLLRARCRQPALEAFELYFPDSAAALKSNSPQAQVMKRIMESDDTCMKNRDAFEQDMLSVQDWYNNNGPNAPSVEQFDQLFPSQSEDALPTIILDWAHRLRTISGAVEKISGKGRRGSLSAP